MKHSWLCLVVLFALVRFSAFGQQPGMLDTSQQTAKASDTLSLNSGKIVGSIYSNECLGFSLPIPAEWEITGKIVGSDIKASHRLGGGLDLLLLRPQGKPADIVTIHLIARDAKGESGPVQEYVSTTAHQRANLRLPDGTLIQRELIQDATPVDYGGRQFFRAKLKQSVLGTTTYAEFAYTNFRGFFIGEEVGTESLDESDRAIDLLRGISFLEDERDSRCVEDPAPKLRVRVSEGVSQRLLITRIEPRYPDEARQAHAEGPVVLKALIGTNGNVEDLTSVSGDSLLIPAAIEAVRQWKYKPYLLNGEAVTVETQVTVSFAIATK